MKKLTGVLFFIVFCLGCSLKAMSTIHVEKQNCSEQMSEQDSMTIAFNERIKSDTIVGDFNGDGTKEKVWFVTPRVINWDEQKCDGPIKTVICCSDAKVKKLEYNLIIGGRLQNLGDINDDGCDELGYYDGWFLSNWHSYHILRLKKGKIWKEIVSPFLMWDVWDNEVAKTDFIPVKKLDKQHVTVYEYNFGTETFDSKVVKLK